MITLAGLLLGEGMYDESESLYRRAVDATEMVLGDDDPTTLQAMSGYSDLWVHQGKYKDAQVITQRVHSKRKSILGETHPETFESLHNIAVV